MEKKPHILCVDDDDKIRELLKVFLTKNNFRVSIAGNANQAKNLILGIWLFRRKLKILKT